MNKKIELIEQAWKSQVEAQMKAGILADIITGSVTPAEYAGILGELFWQVREHPQHLAAQTVKLNGEARKLVGPILKHAASEVGHEEWALRDREFLGFPREEVLAQGPGLATRTIIQFMRECHAHPNPAAYMGYVFHLEFLPTQFGKQIGAGLIRAGIPEGALGFLEGHIDADEGHNKIMEMYINQLILTPADLDLFIDTALKTATLYRDCLESAASRGRSKSSGRLGFSERIKAQRVLLIESAF